MIKSKSKATTKRKEANRSTEITMKCALLYLQKRPRDKTFRSLHDKIRIGSHWIIKKVSYSGILLNHILEIAWMESNKGFDQNKL